MDYFDVYSHVTRITTIWVLIDIAATYNLEIHQMDVKTAFLYGELEDDVCMVQQGFVVSGQKGNVYKLVPSFYGLQQAPKQWHEKFNNIVISYDFVVCDSHKYLYYNKFLNLIFILCLYADDILIFGSDANEISKPSNF